MNLNSLINYYDICRGAMKLGRVDDDDIAASDPDWSFDALVSELNAMENNLSANSSTPPLHFHQTTSSRYQHSKTLSIHYSFFFCTPTVCENNRVNFLNMSISLMSN